MKRKRIAIFAYNHPESTLPLAKYFAKLDYEVDYYFVTFPRQMGSSAFDFGRRVWFPGLRWNNRKYMKPLLDYMESDAVHIYLLVLPPFALRHLYLLSKTMFTGMSILLRLKNYDFINIVGQNRPILDLMRFIGKTKKLFVSLHEVTAHYNAQKVESPYLDYLVENRVNIIVHSAASCRKLLDYGESIGRSTSVIPFGVFETYSLCPAAEMDLNVENGYMLYYGNILPYKGLDILYEAVQLLGSDVGTMKFVIAGHGEDPALSRMADDGRFVVINRYLTNGEIVSLNRDAICVICPYKSASQSGIVSTSYLYSVPIIASDVGGFSDYVMDGENGLLVEPGNAAALAEAIRKVLQDDVLRAKLRHGAARFSASEPYSWGSIARRYIEVFEK